MESVSPSYFMHLPVECLELIIRLVQELLFLEIWGDICTDTTTKSLDNHRNFSLLFSQASPFRSVVSSMFTDLYLDSYEVYGERHNLVFPSSTESSIKISVESHAGWDIGLIRQIFRICGPSTESISFGTMEFDNTTEGEKEKTEMAHKVSSIVLQHCANIKHLLFLQHERFKPNWIAEKLVFHKFATQLNSLTLRSNFPTTMPGLGMCSSLRELRYMGGCSEHLIQLLPSIGGTLEHLYVEKECSYSNGDLIEREDSESDWEKLFEVTRKTCSRLHTFYLSGIAYVPSLARNPRYVALLCSYGNQLIRANLNLLAPEALQRVIASCPRLDVDNSWSFHRPAYSPKCVSVLGPRLQSLELRTPVVPANEWAKILAKCSNLRELALHFDLGPRQLPALPRLETFKLQEVCVSAQYISHLASISSNLRSVEFQFSPDIQSGSIFKPLVESNKFLRDVSITEHVSERQPRVSTRTRSSLQLVRELVETFSKCHKLDIRLFEIEGEHITSVEVQSICGVLPCRRVEVLIEISPHVFYWQTGKTAVLEQRSM